MSELLHSIATRPGNNNFEEQILSRTYSEVGNLMSATPVNAGELIILVACSYSTRHGH